LSAVAVADKRARNNRDTRKVIPMDEAAQDARVAARRWPQLPFYYGWLIIAVAFVTMAIAVTSRTAFSLLLPPLTREFGWDRGLVAGAFSFGFLISAAIGPVVGRIMDRHGPRVLIGGGVCLMSAGLFLAPSIDRPWQLYATLGVAVGGGANLMTYTTHSQFLPNWFVRRRAFAISLAFSGVGVGAIVLLPWLQTIIGRDGWRTSCRAMGLLILLVVGPLTLLVRGRPQDIGLLPDGDARASGEHNARATLAVVDPDWAAVDWTLARAMRTSRFWWIMVGYFCAMIAWYAGQVHQTAYLVEVGFTPIVAAWSLGIVSVAGIPGQIGLGALSDRVGREWVWTAACCGFAISYAALIALQTAPSLPLLYVMAVSQGFLGYAAPSVLGPIVAEIFEGRHFGAIFGAVTVALVGGGAAGPWVTGVIHDATGSYRAAFLLAIGCCAVSSVAIWIAAPRKVRAVPGRVARARVTTA
jgi:MFS family permease